MNKLRKDEMKFEHIFGLFWWIQTFWLCCNNIFCEFKDLFFLIYVIYVVYTNDWHGNKTIS